MIDWRGKARRAGAGSVLREHPLNCRRHGFVASRAEKVCPRCDYGHGAWVDPGEVGGDGPTVCADGAALIVPPTRCHSHFVWNTDA